MILLKLGQGQDESPLEAEALGQVPVDVLMATTKVFNRFNEFRLIMALYDSSRRSTENTIIKASEIITSPVSVIVDSTASTSSSAVANTLDTT
ncbi:hypothetical protein TNCV_2479011 [Trichonephila clavipes]|nr:hypothetical protein TNCV_2479011 [Trichonephila clavipes]